MSVVTPLFKKKGSTDDLNSYRGVSVLPPIAKLFEKLIHKQISIYLAEAKILNLVLIDLLFF
ncbi:RNA-directed DNA polymerase from transposon BS [Brachionus plicatilis]|uniref:RNA-directed DNA polymerase from transposon BS n=1 Tax=Brachionus plicatilis TaxID=10195 RepID=A0A3M7SNL5_BRAPC|nr:RNA-directed DNA polymerase from transposon BS [Brachionus plicatilis]